MRVRRCAERIGAADDGRSEPSAIMPNRSVTACASSAGRRTMCTSQKPITAVLRAISVAGSDRRRWSTRRHAEDRQPSQRSQGGQALVEHRTAGHLEDDVDRPAVVRLDAGHASCPRSVESTATSAPRSRVSCRLSSLDAVAITRPAPHRLASCIATVPTPPAPACTTTDSPGARWVLVRSRCQAVAPCTRVVNAAPSSTAVGNREQAARVGGDLLGVAAAAEQTEQPLPVRAADDHLAARNHRQRLLGEVGVLGRVRVGVVDARGEDIEHLLPVAGLRVGKVADD